jgi:hypothetical protein
VQLTADESVAGGGPLAAAGGGRGGRDVPGQGEDEREDVFGDGLAVLPGGDAPIRKTGAMRRWTAS